MEYPWSEILTVSDVDALEPGGFAWARRLSRTKANAWMRARQALGLDPVAEKKPATKKEKKPSTSAVEKAEFERVRRAAEHEWLRQVNEALMNVDAQAFELALSLAPSKLSDRAAVEMGIFVGRMGSVDFGKAWAAKCDELGVKLSVKDVVDAAVCEGRLDVASWAMSRREFVAMSARSQRDLWHVACSACRFQNNGNADRLDMLALFDALPSCQGRSRRRKAFREFMHRPLMAFVARLAEHPLWEEAAQDFERLDGSVLAFVGIDSFDQEAFDKLAGRPAAAGFKAPRWMEFATWFGGGARWLPDAGYACARISGFHEAALELAASRGFAMDRIYAEGKTLLHVVAETNYLEYGDAVQVLIEAGLDPARLDDEGIPAWMRALSCNNASLFPALSAGCDLTAGMDRGRGGFHAQWWHGAEEVEDDRMVAIRALLRAGVDPSAAPRGGGLSPMENAARKGSVVAFKEMLAFKRVEPGSKLSLKLELSLRVCEQRPANSHSHFIPSLAERMRNELGRQRFVQEVGAELEPLPVAAKASRRL